MPRSARPPWFKFYPADWLIDPQLNGLSWDQKGRFIHAIALTYQTARPGVASEEQWRQWMQLSEAEWAEQREAIARVFRIAADGTWTQKRVQEEEKARLRSKKSRQKGASITNDRRTISHAERTSERDVSERSRVATRARGSEAEVRGRGQIPESDPVTNGVHEAGAVAVPGAVSRARQRAASVLGEELIAEMAEQFPEVDVETVAVKSLEKPSRNPKLQFRNWCRTAHERGIDLKPRESAMAWALRMDAEDAKRAEEAKNNAAR